MVISESTVGDMMRLYLQHSHDGEESAKKGKKVLRAKTLVRGRLFLFIHTQARNATDWMQVVGFAALIQVCDQVASSLLASSNYVKSVLIRLDAI